METRNCKDCGGSGTVIGGGMIPGKCEHCKGVGKIVQPENDIDYLEKKSTDAYKAAVDRIKSSDEKITHEEAEEMLNKGFENIEKTESQSNHKTFIYEAYKDGDDIGLQTASSCINTANETFNKIETEEPKKRGRPKK